ncbi:MAG: tRNA (adenosine(37)-N6)-dimethylallyltransferase MiaA [Evtepia sp.]
MPPHVVVICGPTASGKTRLGIALCSLLNGEVVSADSMQIYRDMNIGTAKPSKEEMRGIPHHMIDIVDPDENYSVARYVQDATRATDDILARNKIPFIVGGTGLYIDALCNGHGFLSFDPNTRLQLQERARNQGIQLLWTELSQIDPEAAARLHSNDEKRILRALEVFYETGKTITAHNRETQLLPPRYQSTVISLQFAERRQQNEQINRRVDEMMRNGFQEEVRSLLKRGIRADATAMQAIGYRELATVLLSGADLTAATEEIKLHSRQYAKRQLTWFRRNANAHRILWGDQPDFSTALQDSANFIALAGLG